MRSPVLSLIVLFCFSTLCLAQTSTSTPYAITGLTSQRQLGELTLVGQDSKPVLKPIGLIEVNKDATNVSVVAFNSKFDIVVATQVAPNTFVIDQPGSWVIVIRGDKVEGPGLSKLVIGPPDVPTPIPPIPPSPPGPIPPDPIPPDPTPTPIPPDDFDNLGQRLDKLADSLNLAVAERLKFSEIYSDTAKKMKEFKILKVSDAVKQLTTARDALNLPTTWNNINKMIYDDGQRVMGREEVIIWYNVIADGIKG